MLRENLRPSKLGGKIWLKETVSTNQLYLICRYPEPLNAAPTLEEVTNMIRIILFSTVHDKCIYHSSEKNVTVFDRLLLS